jgi:acetyl esterase/lipase
MVLGLVAFGIALGIAAYYEPFKTLNAFTLNDTYNKTSDLAYGPDPRNKLDVYAPKNAKGPAPVVIFLYGGNWNSGERGDYRFIGEALASRGMVAVVADYRLYPQVRYPGFLEDAAQAVAWTATKVAQYGGDPQHLYLMGHSAGAYNSAMIALDRRWLAAQHMTPAALRGWIGVAGPYDFVPIIRESVRPVFFYPDTPPESQPINHVTAGAPPALLVAPQDDAVVNQVRNTGGLAKQLRAVGVNVTETYFDHTNHSILIATMAWPLRGLAPLLDTVERFVASDGGRLSAALLAF